MPPHGTRVRRGFSRRRQTVRIVRPRRITHSAALTLLIAAMAAAVLFLTWRYWHVEEIVPRRTPALSERFVDWKCESGHVFEDRGRVKPRICPTCKKPAYPFGLYRCPVHGVFEVAVQYAKDEKGAPRLSKYRLNAGEWVDAEKKPHCARCGRPLERKPRDPFQRRPRGGRRGGRQ